MWIAIWEPPGYFSHPLGFEEPDLEAESSQTQNIGSFLTEAAVNRNWGEKSKTQFIQVQVHPMAPVTQTLMYLLFFKCYEQPLLMQWNQHQNSHHLYTQSYLCAFAVLWTKIKSHLWYWPTDRKERAWRLALIQQIPLSREDLLYLMAVCVLLIWDLKNIS